MRLKLRKRDRELAESDKHLGWTCLPDSRTPAQMLEAYESFFLYGGGRDSLARAPRKYRFRTKRSNSKYTTIGRRTVWLSKRYHDKSDREKAITLGHEAVHVRQQRGRWFRWLRSLARARTWWAYEMQGYRESLRIARACGVSEDGLRARAKNHADSMRGYPFARRINKNDFRKWTFGILMEEVER